MGNLNKNTIKNVVMPDGTTMSFGGCPDCGTIINYANGDRCTKCTVARKAKQEYSLYRKCSCGRINKSDGTDEIIGENDMGLWVNCTCGSTMLFLSKKAREELKAAAAETVAIETDKVIYPEIYI